MKDKLAITEALLIVDKSHDIARASKTCYISYSLINSSYSAMTQFGFLTHHTGDLVMEWLQSLDMNPAAILPAASCLKNTQSSLYVKVTPTLTIYTRLDNI